MTASHPLSAASAERPSRAELATGAIARQAGRAVRRAGAAGASPPAPAMVPDTSPERGCIRAGASEIPEPVQKARKPNAGSWAPGQSGLRGGKHQIWAHASKNKREEFQINREDRCAACGAPKRRTVTDTWECWGCTQSVTPLRTRMRVIELWDDQSLSSAAIGERIGISKCAVIGLVRRMGLEARPSPIKPGTAGSSKPASVPKITKRGQPFYIRPKTFVPLPSFEPARLAGAAAVTPIVAALPGGSADVAENTKAEPKATPPQHGFAECQYIIGESPTRRPRAIFCDSPAKPGSPFCDTHHRRCYMKVAA